MTLSFHIQAAFDSVWCHGLIFKMLEIKIPYYLIRWTLDYLTGRSLEVKVNQVSSDLVPIIAGVPKGSSLSTILFNIFINDIPAHHTSTTGFSLLFVDDLTSSYIFNKIKIKDCDIVNRTQEYLKDIEMCLCK